MLKENAICWLLVNVALCTLISGLRTYMSIVCFIGLLGFVAFLAVAPAQTVKVVRPFLSGVTKPVLLFTVAMEVSPM